MRKNPGRKKQRAESGFKKNGDSARTKSQDYYGNKGGIYKTGGLYDPLTPDNSKGQKGVGRGKVRVFPTVSEAAHKEIQKAYGPMLNGGHGNSNG